MLCYRRGGALSEATDTCNVDGTKPKGTVENVKSLVPTGFGMASSTVPFVNTTFSTETRETRDSQDSQDSHLFLLGPLRHMPALGAATKRGSEIVATVGAAAILKPPTFRAGSNDTVDW